MPRQILAVLAYVQTSPVPLGLEKASRRTRWLRMLSNGTLVAGPLPTPLEAKGCRNVQKGRFGKSSGNGQVARCAGSRQACVGLHGLNHFRICPITLGGSEKVLAKTFGQFLKRSSSRGSVGRPGPIHSSLILTNHLICNGIPLR